MKTAPEPSAPLTPPSSPDSTPPSPPAEPLSLPVRPFTKPCGLLRLTAQETLSLRSLCENLRRHHQAGRLCELGAPSMYSLLQIDQPLSELTDLPSLSRFLWSELQEESSRSPLFHFNEQATLSLSSFYCHLALHYIRVRGISSPEFLCEVVTCYALMVVSARLLHDRQAARLEPLL